MSGSRSVLDLSQPHQGSLDYVHHSPSVPVSPTGAHPLGGPNASSPLGDLRSLSRKAWSRSADDLNQVPSSPISTMSFQDRIAEYRGRSGSNASALIPPSPSSPNVNHVARHPFPSYKAQQPEGGSENMPILVPPGRSATLPTVSISVSPPGSTPININSDSNNSNITSTNVLSSSPSQIQSQTQAAQPPPLQSQSTTQQAKPSHVHTRSHSFTPKLPSKLSNPKLVLSPKRKGSGSNERDIDSQYQQLQQRAGQEILYDSRQHGHGTGQQTMTPTRAGFAFPFVAGSGNHRDANQGGGFTAQHPNRMTMLLAPPTIVEPKSKSLSLPNEDENSSSSKSSARRASQIVYHSGFINRLADSSYSSPFHHHSHAYFTRGDALAKGWKSYKMELKGTKLFFYKPPSDRSAGIKELFPTGLVPPSLEDDADDGEGFGEGREKDLPDPPDPFAVSFVLGASQGKGKARDGGMSEVGGGALSGRRRRAFWGRIVHPDLVRDIQNGKLEKGTFEALTHEAVFATTFLSCESSTPNHSETTQPKSKEDEERALASWRLFASSVLLSLPSIVGRPTFESEFMRCCAYLISGADEESGEKEREKGRVVWLVREYLGYTGKLENEGEWEGWVKENLGCELGKLKRGEGLESGRTADMGSPNLNTFSPRPDVTNGKFVSLMEALQLGTECTTPAGTLSKAMSTVSSTTSASTKTKQSLDLRTFEHQLPPLPPSPSVSHPQQSQQHLPPTPVRQNTYPSRIPWLQLQGEGFSREILLMLDPHFVARSLTLYHRSVVDHVPDELTSEYLLPSGESGSSGEGSAGEVTEELDPVFGSDEKPHWLTKLILLQILGADTSSSSHHHHTLQSPARKSEDHSGPGANVQPQQSSRTHSRSEVISVWAKVGELCRMSGDECSWRSIVEALCSRPVARLEKVWRRVDPLALQAIESWVYPLNTSGEVVFSGGFGPGGAGSGTGAPVGVKEPRVTPWGGNMRAKISEELAKVKDDQMLSVDALTNVHSLFSSFRAAIGSCPKRTQVEEGEISEDVKRMVGFWREMASEGGGKGSLAGKLKKVEQFMTLSMAAEPRRRGMFEPHFWARAIPSAALNVPLHVPSLVPLIFPEPLSSVALVDRTQLIRGRVDSDASDIQYLRGAGAGMDPQLRILRATQNVNEVTKRLIMGTGGTVISLYDGELMLVVQPGGMEPSSRPSSRAPSRPPSSVIDGLTGMGAEREKPLSRAPSIRVKPTSSQVLERKTSMARRNSLPSLSHRPNFTISERSPDPPLRVLVQAGTLNALVNILVHGLRNVSVSVADDNGEMTLREGMTRELVVDRMEFARVWWNVFRSFLTPLVFFELLRKMYITAQPSGSSPSVADYLEVLSSRTRVLELISDWLTAGGGAQDVLDDPHLYTALKSFLNTSADHVVFKTENFEEPDVAAAWVGLIDTKALLQSTFDAQTKRPMIQRTQQVGNLRRGSASTVAGVLGAFGGGGRARGASIRDPPDLDGMNVEELVDTIDGMARAALSNVTEEDLYVTTDLLEVQTSDRTGWFSPREAGHSDEAIEIQNMYTHIQEVEPSNLISEMTQDALYRLLPPSIRSCIRAYGIIRKWLISKLVVPRLGLRGRQARMELLLQAIEIARLRNAEPNVSHHIEQPCVRSFVEAVVTSAVISVESRMHQRPWQFIAYNRGCTCESLAALLARPSIQSTSSRDCLTVDMGWLIERMLEVIASPDVVETSVQDGQSLVNFDKRRHLCNLVNRATSLPFPRKTLQSDETTRRGFERLNVIEREVLYLQFDHRGIREESTREAFAASAPPSIKKVAKPFQKLVALQMEKNRRDKNLRLRMQKEKFQEQSRNDRREDMLNKAMRPKKQMSSAAQKQHRNKKSMSAFLSFMRPISSAFGAELSITSGVKKTAEELDFPTSGKPSLVLSIMDAKVAQFINNERSFTFQLKTEDGGNYILQAVNKKEMNKWLETINKVTSTAAKRRLTYLGPKPQLQDHIHEHSAVASRDPRAVFGVELQYLLQREAGGGPVPPGTVPIIIDQCLSEVESRGLSEVGIYRIAGAVSEINALKDAYNRGEYPITDANDIHAVCDLVKAWFRVLPEPVFPPSSYHDIMSAMRIENLEDRLSAIHSVVQALPQANFDLLKRVAEHLDKVTDYEEHNQMTAEALAIVFSPNLLRAPQNDFVTILNNMGQSHKLVKALITHFHKIFDEADPEAEVHSDEDDMESPILEEEEEEEAEPANLASQEVREFLRFED